MVKLKRIPHKLTISEALVRLNENPNDPDPEIQRAKKTLEDFYARLAPSITEVNQFYKNLIASIQPTLRLTNVLLSTIKPPPDYIFDNIRKMHEDIQGLTAPMKVLIESIASLQAPLIFPILSKVDKQYIAFESEKIFQPIAPPVKSYQAELLEENNRLLDQLVRIQQIEPKIKGKPFFLDYESKTFIVKEVNWRALNLHTESGKDSMSIFFTSLLEFLEANGKMDNQVLKVPIFMTELIEKLKSKGIIEATKAWVKSTKSNLKNKKIIPSKLENVIIIEDHDDRIDGFYFGIKLPIEDPDSA